MKTKGNQDNYERLFNKIILTYNDPKHLMYKKMSHILRYITPGDTLIDVGCGIGEFIVRIQDQFNTIVGVDISQPEIDFAKKRIGNSKKVFFIVEG